MSTPWVSFITMFLCKHDSIHRKYILWVDLFCALFISCKVVGNGIYITILLFLILNLCFFVIVARIVTGWLSMTNFRKFVWHFVHCILKPGTFQTNNKTVKIYSVGICHFDSTWVKRTKVLHDLLPGTIGGEYDIILSYYMY